MENRMLIATDLREARKAEGVVMDQVARHAYSEGAAFAIKLALDEGLNNAIRHGNRFDRSKSVELLFEVDTERIVIVITDQGEGFDPLSVPDPTADENLEKPTGRGIMLMHAYMDEVCFNRKGNQVRMVKRNN